MRRNARTVAPILLVVAVLGVVLWVNAGDINPPPGPVAPTMKALSAIEPRIAVNAENTPGDADATYVISQPGSYYLTANLIGEVGKSGIQISADNVTVDLNGFALIGGDGTLHGIVVDNDRLKPVVRNGTICDWGMNGVRMFNQLVPSGGQFSDLNLRNNLDGLLIVGTGSRVVNCIAESNRRDGIGADGACVVIGCTAAYNAHNGFCTGYDTIFIDCTATNNEDDGFDMAGGCVVKACTSTRNAANGIAVRDFGSVITDCAVMLNDGVGILFATGTYSDGREGTVRGCSVVRNLGGGIRAVDCLIHSNTVISNTGFNIDGSGTSTLIDNHAP